MIKNARKSQISIFIVIALIIIFSVSFLFFADFEDRKIQNKEGVEKAISQKQDLKLFPVKDRVDFCLSHSLKRALILSGIRGGFIYDEGENYTKGTVESYDTQFLELFNFSINNFYERSLIHSDYIVYSPFVALDSESIKYGTHRVDKDIEKFMMENFMECVDLSEYEEKGYDVLFLDSVGKVIDKSDLASGKIIVSGFDADVGDYVGFSENESVVGEITKVTDSGFEVEFKEDVSSGLGKLLGASNLPQVINLNKSISSKVYFQDKEKVTAQLNFPIRIMKEDFVTSYPGGYVDVPIRFSELLRISRFLLNKKVANRSLDLTDAGDLGEVSSSIKFADSGFKLKRVELVNEENVDSYKSYIYSIEDEYSKILNRPFVLNFGYVNHAPLVDASDESIIVEGNDIVFYVVENENLELELTEYFYDPEFIDNYNFYFEGKVVNANNYNFELSSGGSVNFKSTSRGRFEVPIVVTDGEAKREYDLVFTTGLSDNENNGDAKGCFVFENEDKDNFPIDFEFQDKIFEKVNSEEYHEVYGFSLNSGSGSVRLKESCLFDEDRYTAVWKENGKVVSVSGNEYTFSGLTDFTQITVEVVNSNNPGAGSVITPYRFNIVPAGCLGPGNEFSYFLGDDIETVIGGVGTCCDLKKVRDYDISTKSAVENIFNGEKAIDAEVYACLFDTDFDYINNILWDEYGTDITSLFKGRLTATCKGTFPEVENNIDSVTTSGTKDIETFVLGSGESVELSLHAEAGKCKFCDLENIFTYDLELEAFPGVKFMLGFVDLNSGAGVYPMPPIISEEDDDGNIIYSEPTPLFLCEDFWTASTFEDFRELLDWPVVDEPSDVYASKSYCSDTGDFCERYEWTQETMKRGDRCNLVSSNVGDNPFPPLFSSPLAKNTVIEKNSDLDRVSVCEDAGIEGNKYYITSCLTNPDVGVGGIANPRTDLAIFEVSDGNVKYCFNGGTQVATKDAACTISASIGTRYQSKDDGTACGENMVCQSGYCVDS